MAGWSQETEEREPTSCGARACRPQGSPQSGLEEFILGQSATKLLVPSAFFLLRNHFEQK